MTGYHATTPRKLARYEATGCILPPVRFWRSAATAQRWAERTKRSVVLAIEVPEPAYPLPDHQPPGMAWWTPGYVRRWTLLRQMKEGQ